MSRLSFGILILMLAVASGRGATYWVAPDGSDTNAGTLSNAPFATPHKAVTAALAPGDTIYIRGGNYSFNSRISPGSSKFGAAGNPIKFWAYPGELPVFDFDSMPESADKALDMRRSYWHVKGIEVKNAPDSGIFVGGTGVIIEGCVIHDCDNDGLVIGSSSVRGTNALILNCDSYRNYQVGSGGNNGDGFAAKVGCGPGNVFKNCRAWDNADDGWDFYDNTNSVTIEGCWAFRNGYDLWGVGAGWTGNGNGFKLGGEGTPAEHFLTNSVAFGNRSKGFDHNNGDAGQTMVNCTSVSNGAANYSFFETPTKGPRLYNLLINCVSFGGGALTNLAANTVALSNSWQIASTTAADFASLDTIGATNARNADFTLPTSSLFRLVAGSDLIDRGLNVGLPFNGSAPDLGAFEFAPAGPRLIQVGNGGWTNGLFRLDASGLTAHGPVIVHASTNLVAWTVVHTNAPTAGTLTFTDAAAQNFPRRFYRVEEQ